METPSGMTASLADQRISRWPAWILAVLLALYILGGIPAASTLCKYHLDEAYYTDAALQMRTSGDYLTPRWDDGRPRFHKPVYTYWLVAAGFAVGGPGLLAARLPFLLLGALVVWLTFVLARRLYGCAETALWAAVLLLSNLLFMDAAGHALPDTLLLAGIVVSQLGLVSVVLLGRRSWPEYFCAYGGAGLAVGSKGLSGLLPLVGAVLYMAWARQRARRSGNEAPSFRVLWHGPAIAAGLFIGCWWFITEYARFGGEFLEGFLGDQFVRKLENSKWGTNLPVYTLFTVGSFLPWLIPLWSRLRRGSGSPWPPMGTVRSMVLYAVVFAALVILTYAPGNITYERYMLSAAPLLAVALAGWLAPAMSGSGEGRPLTRWLTGIFYVVTIPAVVLAVVLLVLAREQELPGLTNGCWLMVSGGVGLCLVRYWRPSLTAVALGMFLMLLTFVYENQFRPTYRSPPAPGIAEALKARGARKALVVTWSKALDSQLRVISGGTIEVVECLAGDAIRDTKNRFVVVPQRFREKFAENGFELTRVAWRYESVNLRKLFAALRQGEAQKYLEKHREYFWLAERK
jgi:4-amino-4-deoxy-L-arabinose transferase-like glycosyltransferase